MKEFITTININISWYQTVNKQFDHMNGGQRNNKIELQINLTELMVSSINQLMRRISESHYIN